jgi:hypothetical protein
VPDFEQLKSALDRNKSLCSIDIRANPGYSDRSSTVKEIEDIVRGNEFEARKANGHPH